MGGGGVDEDKNEYVHFVHSSMSDVGGRAMRYI